MRSYSPSLFFLCLLFFVQTLKVQGQLITNPNIANFFTVTTNQLDSLVLNLQNQYSTPYTVSNIQFYHVEFSAAPTSFVISPGGSQQVKIYFSCSHNLNFMDYAMIESPDKPGIAVQTFASGQYPDTYYSSTQNLSHEELKAELKSILTTTHVQLSYNVARDDMYMDIDNQAVNGQGASQNTIECVYTSRQVLGYASRTDAQSSGNFDTEHTFPQSFFSSNLPMLSDLHHLFPTWSSANNERGNKPFGIVSAPTWTDGGSKSSSSTFEPRDLQKGKTARALFYFVLRYQDYAGFLSPQESILRTWALTFAPNAIDSARNNSIFVSQQNRNPLVDHPEFFDRIASICNVDSGPLFQDAWHLPAMNFGSSSTGTPVVASVPLSNQGRRRTLNLSNFSLSDPTFTFSQAPETEVKPDSIKYILIQFLPTTPNQNYTANLTFQSDEVGNPTITIPLSGNTIPVSREWGKEILLNVFPNPSTGKVTLIAPEIGGDFRFFNTHGQEFFLSETQATQTKWEVDLPSGIYFIEWVKADKRINQKLIVLD